MLYLDNVFKKALGGDFVYNEKLYISNPQTSPYKGVA